MVLNDVCPKWTHILRIESMKMSTLHVVYVEAAYCGIHSGMMQVFTDGVIAAGYMSDLNNNWMWGGKLKEVEPSWTIGETVFISVSSVGGWMHVHSSMESACEYAEMMRNKEGLSTSAVELRVSKVIPPIGEKVIVKEERYKEQPFTIRAVRLNE